MVADAYNSIIQEADGLSQVQTYPDLQRKTLSIDRQTDR